jgi:hypothetical protein
VGLERGPLSLVSTTEELLRRKSSGSGLENGEYGRRDPSRWPSGTVYPQNFSLASPTSGGRSVAIVCSRTQATESRDFVDFTYGRNQQIYISIIVFSSYINKHSHNGVGNSAYNVMEHGVCSPVK